MVTRKVTYPNDEIIIDRETGLLTPVWQRFFQDMFNFVNDATKKGGSVGFLGEDPSTQLPKITDPTDLPTTLAAVADVIDSLETFGFNSKT